MLGPILDRLVDCLQEAVTLGDERVRALEQEEEELKARASQPAAVRERAARGVEELPSGPPSGWGELRTLRGSVHAAVRWDLTLEEASLLVREIHTDPDLRDLAIGLERLIHAALLGRGEPAWSTREDPAAATPGDLDEARRIYEEQKDRRASGETTYPDADAEIRQVWADLALEVPAELAAMEERLRRWREKEAIKRTAVERALDQARELRQRYVG